MSQECETIARRMIDSFRAGDAETAFDCVDAEGVIREANRLPYGGDWVGPDGFRQIIATMSTTLEIDIVDYTVFDSDEVTVMKANITFTSRATGNKVTMPIVELYRAREGKLIDMDIFYKDTAALIALSQERATVAR
jgi:hypothetical protein